MVDAERVKRLRHFLRAFVERLQVGALHFVQPAHLLDEQLGVALYANRTNAVRLRIIHRRNETVVFGNVVAEPADVLFEFGDDSSVGVANDHAIGGRAGIAARPSVNVDAVRRRVGLRLGSGFAEEAFAARSGRAFWHQLVDAGGEAFAEPSAALV